MKPRSSGSVIRLAAPLRALAQRFSFLLLVLASVALMMVGKIESVSVDSARARVTDAFAPILDAISRPAATAARVVESAVELENAFDENQRLKAENARLLQWKQAALRLEAENNSLRSLLRVRPEPAVNYIAARVIATPGSSFVRTLVVTAGRRDPICPPALTDRLLAYLRAGGADVTVAWHEGGHEVRPNEIEAARTFLGAPQVHGD